MNCCNKNDNFRQGRDCLARHEITEPALAYRTSYKRLDRVLQAISHGVAVLGAMCLAAALIVLLGVAGVLPK